MWDDARQMNALAATLALLAALGLAAALLTYVVRRSAFTFDEVVVTTPLNRANGAHLEGVIRTELSGTFFTMDLAGARQALTRVPWVRDAGLRRQWPNRLEVTIEEHEPLARFNEGGFVDTQGEVFEAQSRDDLPRFFGPEARAGEMTERYRAWSDALRPLSLAVTEMSLSPRGAWRVRAAGGEGALTLELGREDPDARLARFVAAYRQTIGTLQRNGTKIDVVDLRYRNGYAARMPAFREKNVKPAAYEREGPLPSASLPRSAKREGISMTNGIE